MGRPGPAGSGSVAHVELRLAGAFRVVRDRTELTEGQIGSRKSRTLLKLLAVERPGLVPVDRIVEILWPDDQPAAPEQNVAVLVSRLRAALGADLIQGGRAGYRLASGPGIVVDLDVAAGFCAAAEGKVGSAAAVALAAAERAHQLLVAGTAIGDEPYADWADPAREQVRELLRRVRLTAAEAALATGDPRLAAGYAEAAITADPLDEAAHRWYMSASAAAGEQAKALAGDGGTVLRTRCYETERSLFLQPVVEAIAPVVARTQAGALRRLLGEHAAAAAGLLPEVAAILGPPPPGRISMEMERRRAFEALRAILRGLAEHSPVLLLVDDLQYAGQSTIELMHLLGRETAGTRLLVVATVRAENDAQIGAALAPVADRVDLGPLGPEALAQLARATGHGELAGRIMEQTRGHTLFVVEVLRALASGETGVPASLRTAVQARVRRAGLPVETLLRAAAVIGATVDPLVLGTMLDQVPSTTLELCEAALEARLLAVSGRDYEFANDLIREVLYASTPEPTRLAYHRRAADLLTGQPESLARHAAAAGDWLRAARAWLRAGQDAMGRYAASDAAALATQALEAAERLADAELSARALVLRGRAHHATGADAAALADLTLGADQARMAGDRRLEMLALYELGADITVQRGLPIGHYLSNLENGLHIAQSLGDRASEANTLSRLAIVAANRMRLDAALDPARPALPELAVHRV
jgi:DNA-binding SARP family transcriptional activator